MGVTLLEQEQTSYQNYAKKLQARLKYYDQRMRCMSLKPNDLVLVHAKAPSDDHKIADPWEDIPHWVLCQLDDQPVFRVQPVNAVADENIRVLHRNVLFPVQSVTDSNSVIADDGKHFALMKANLLMDIHFNN